MLSILLPAPLIGVLTLGLMLCWLLAIGVMLAPGILLKAIFAYPVPVPAARDLCTRYLTGVADLWTAGNAVIVRLLQDLRWQVTIAGAIEPGRSYLLMANHQSWADILVLCDAFQGRIRFPRFFLKRELIWVPIIGVACWALDMPFMKRHSREALARNPELRSDDLRATREFCEKYRRQPITAIMFPEGTRFTEAKRDGKQSPYRHLLRAKSAGMAFTLNAMGEQFAGLIDVSIAYKPAAGAGGIVWSWLCGQQQTLVVQAELRPIPAELMHGDYDTDAEYRGRFQAWLNGLWARKDAHLGLLKAQALDGIGGSTPAASRH
ncbi:MAG: 1-acyl-sn-glycerol-3-phosphate acyltransferase [Hydrocarboniphaga sp.]|uniref:acyltransferase n=1 Tax=Hydrocarboniphaga sp. TaxID=2033016 RepID=UPI0026341295|nr:acyltransferase [Hydrocarboniphaga sp.]MDB5972148.1 1-acyl-sn-glycerol-3-phosphate acyltransferase [Hydrocarboniphaga sp.]